MDRKTAALVISSLAAVGTWVGAAEARAATPTFYTDLATFQSDITVTVTDDYSDPGYVFIQDDVTMSGVLGETDYMSTGFNNLNIVNGGYYCAGCNGSFELSFLTTSVGVATGVHGVGAHIQTHNIGALPYFAFITFADGTTMDVALPAAGNFWGVAAPERIERIHFGLSGGNHTTNGSFGIDNLIVGSGNVGGCELATDCFDDGDPCTDPACIDELCAWVPNTAPCDDGNVCTEMDTCFEGVCDGEPVDCSDGNECTNNFCDPAGGCVVQPNLEPCDDESICTVNDACSMGSCGGEPLDCSDGDVCTADSCDPVTGCYSEPIADCCADDSECGADEICDPGTNTCVPAPKGTGTGGDDTGGGGTAAEDTGLEESGLPPADTGGGGTAGDSGVGEAGDGNDSIGSTSGSTGAETGGPGASGDSPLPDSSGCACNSAPDPEQGLGWLLLGALGLLGRRRRAA